MKTGFRYSQLTWLRKFVLTITVLSAHGQVSARSYFLDNGNGTVTHVTTRLMWQQEPPDTSRSYVQAKAHCNGLVLGGHQDWRLPQVKELLSLVDYKRANPALDPVVFDAVPNDRSIWAESVAASSTTLYLVSTHDGRLSKLGSPAETTSSALTMCLRSP